jgi:hypothetical protein
MSIDATKTAPPSPASTMGGEAPPTSRGPREIKLVSHSPIFYWWPIWLLGYVMALVTLFENHRLAIVPANSELRAIQKDEEKTRYELTVPNPPTKSLNAAEEATVAAQGESARPQPFKTRISQKAWMGPLYCVILLLTILITNVPMRGLWSFLVILMLLVLALVISLVPNGWEDLLGAFGNLHIFINMAGYLFIATTVLILWAVSVFIFDQRTYMIITPGQIRVCEHIGASIRNFDTTGLSFEKQRDDLFRHWILGFFSGDLIVRTHGAEKEEIRFPNVLWIGWRLEQVQEILREKATVINP